MKIRKLSLSRILILFTLFLLISCIFWSSSFAAPPRQLYLQAKLTNKQGEVITGSHTIKFRLYSAETGGSALWTEEQTITVDNDGIFGAYLGFVTSIPTSIDFNSTYYVSIEVDGDGEMSPRIKLVASPYALGAYMLGGLEPISFLRSDASDNFTSGTLTFDSDTELDVASGSTLDINGDLSVADTSIAFDGSSTNFAITGDFSINSDDLYIDKSTGYVGIGTTSPSVALDVIGDTRRHRRHKRLRHNLRHNHIRRRLD